MAVNCRVVMRDVKHHPDASEEEKKRDMKEAFEGMLAAFRRKLSDSKVLNEYRRRQSYESKGEKRRRKLKENRGKNLKSNYNS